MKIQEIQIGSLFHCHRCGITYMARPNPRTLKSIGVRVTTENYTGCFCDVCWEYQKEDEDNRNKKRAANLYVGAT